MAPELRQEVERYDRWLYSRQGLWFWAGLLLTVVASVAGLMLWVRMSAVEALVLALVFWGSVLLTLTSAWLTPDQFVWSGRMNWGKWTKGALAGVLGMLVGLLVSRAVSGDLGQLLDGQRLLNTFWRGLPWMIGALAVMGLITGAVAHLSRWRLQIQVRSLRLAAERDAASRDAAEARLKLLQAQIRPHFIFNTLSAVQHWVDQADPRGAPLLRSLTAFLQGSTDMMGRDAVPLAHEMTMVGHYLDIMKARLGDRLHCVVDPPAAHFHDLMLPPGLVLTLVENAIEHGVEPLLRGGGVEVRLQESSEALCIDVLDEGPGLPDPLREGVGLSNTRARLAQALGPQAVAEIARALGFHGVGLAELHRVLRELAGLVVLEQRDAVGAVLREARAGRVDRQRQLSSLDFTDIDEAERVTPHVGRDVGEVFPAAVGLLGRCLGEGLARHVLERQGGGRGGGRLQELATVGHGSGHPGLSGHGGGLLESTAGQP
jgi:hypothetical protein